MSSAPRAAGKGGLIDFDNTVEIVLLAGILNYVKLRQINKIPIQAPTDLASHVHPHRTKKNGISRKIL